MRVETKVLRFWNSKLKKGDLANIAHASGHSLRKIKEAVYIGDTQEYIEEDITNYFKNKKK